MLASFKAADAEMREGMAKQFAGLVRAADAETVKLIVPSVVEALKGEPAPVQKSLITGLARIALRVDDETAIKPALEPLKATMESKSKCVKCHGASALGCVATVMKEQDAKVVRYSLETLIDGMKGKGGHSVMGSVRQFCQIGPRVKDPALRESVIGILVRLTKSKMEEARPEAQKALALMRAAEGGGEGEGETLGDEEEEQPEEEEGAGEEAE